MRVLKITELTNPISILEAISNSFGLVR